MHIETKRLLLRPLQHSDIGPLSRIWTDPRVTRYMGGPRKQEEVRASLEEDLAAPAPGDTAPAGPHSSGPDDLDLWPVIEKATGAVVGDCGLLAKEVDGQDEVELVYVLAASAWGKGYATEIGRAIRDYAFDELGLERIISLIDPQNAASARVAEKVGMRLEKETVRPGGKTMRVYAMGRTDRRRLQQRGLDADFADSRLEDQPVKRRKVAA